VTAELVDCVGLTHDFANFVELVPAAADALAETLQRFRLLQAGVPT
jgi:hypothetical protein